MVLQKLVVTVIVGTISLSNVPNKKVDTSMRDFPKKKEQKEQVTAIVWFFGKKNRLKIKLNELWKMHSKIVQFSKS